MQDQFFVRMGDGERVLMSVGQIEEDLLTGTQDAAERAEIPALTVDEVEQLLDILTDPSRIVSVAPGEEVVTTDDAVCTLFYLDQDNSGQGIPMSRLQSVLAYERACAADTVSIGHTDYSYKQVKPIINFEKQEYHTASLMTTAPFFYGSQPNMGLYFQPDGPYPNPADLLPKGKIREAQEVQEAAAERLRKDMVFISKNLFEVGCEGINFDTSASAGDADFYATLQAASQLKRDFSAMAVEVGMSSEFVLGMHGDIQFEGKPLAGMYPHEQVKVVEAAGADIFGPAINVNSSKSIPWNLARAVTFVKATVEVASIPVHPNVGMGVCGVPVFEVPPIDAVTRAAKSLVQIGKADGL
jgi:dimethylamine---corrinoid protein Co-methyltransferase